MNVEEFEKSVSESQVMARELRWMCCEQERCYLRGSCSAESVRAYSITTPTPSISLSTSHGHSGQCLVSILADLLCTCMMALYAMMIVRDRDASYCLRTFRAPNEIGHV
jgi:hypothetical protein